MALSPCVPCNCIPGTFQKDKFMQDVEIILCGILTAVSGGGSNVNLTGINGIAPSVGNGITDTGTLRVTLSNDSTGKVAATQSGIWNIGTLTTITNPVAVTQSGAWAVSVTNGAGAAAVNIQDGGNSITVDGTVAATQSGTWNIGTITTITNPVAVTQAAASVASGAYSSGAFASGSFASGALSSGSVASGAIASGALASGSIAAGAVVAGATSFVKLEDVLSADGDAGVPAMAVQRASPGDTAGNLDYSMLQMSAGRLWCSATVDAALPTGANVIGAVTQSGTWNVGTITTITNPVAVTQASGSVASGAYSTGSFASGALASGALASGALASGSVASGALASGSIASGAIVAGAVAAGATSFVKLEDVLSADADAGVPAMAVQRASPGDTAGNLDYSMLQMSAGRLWCSATIDAALPTGANVIGAVTQSGTWNVGTVTAVTSITNPVAVTQASGSVASGAYSSGAFASGSHASGSIASGAYASGSIGSGAIASGAVASGAIASGAIVAGAIAAGPTSFVKLEDVGSADADAGVPAMAVRKAAPANTSGSDGDYEFLQMSAGRLWASTNVDQINGVAPTMGNGAVGSGSLNVTISSNSTGNIATIGTSITPGTAAGNLGKAEDAAHVSGDTGVAAWGVANLAMSSFAADGDYTPFAVDLKGRTVTVLKTPTGTLSNVSSSATSVTVLASNTSRNGATIVNDSTQILYLKFGTTASATSYTVQMAANAYYEVPFGYTGIIDGIWASANGNARVTEIT